MDEFVRCIMWAILESSHRMSTLKNESKIDGIWPMGSLDCGPTSLKNKRHRIQLGKQLRGWS
jgi:hypothetical protein